MTSSLWIAVAVLGDFSAIESMSREFRGRRAEFTGRDVGMGLAILVGIVLVLWALSRLLAYQQRSRRRNDPKGLFKALCKAHRLDRRNRQLLRKLADRRGLRQPAMIFLDPKRFEPGELSAELKPRANEVRALARRLFATVPAAVAKPAETPTVSESPTVEIPTTPLAAG